MIKKPINLALLLIGLLLIIPAYGGQSFTDKFSNTAFDISLSKPVKINDTYQWYGLLKVDLGKGWHSYWRSEGGTGIATELHIEPGQAQLFYQKPIYIATPPDWSIGYEQPFTIAFTIKSQTIEPSFRVNINMGLCKDLCMPFAYSLNLSSTSQSEKEEAALINSFQQLAKQPTNELRLTKYSLQNNKIYLSFSHPASDELPTLFLESEAILGQPKVTEHSLTETSYIVDLLYASQQRPIEVKFTGYIGDNVSEGHISLKH